MAAPGVADPKDQGDREQNRVLPSARSIQSVGGLVAVVAGTQTAAEAVLANL